MSVAPASPGAAEAAADATPPGAGSDCHNYGVVSMVTVLGTNYYCAEGTCTNHGVFVAVGDTRSCHGNGYAVACVGAECAVGSASAEAAAPPCGIATDPVCWAFRLACGNAIAPAHYEVWYAAIGQHGNGPSWDPPCECHAGDPGCERAAIMTRGGP